MAEITMDDLLRAAFAPWDERSWDNLLETYPEAALALETAVDAGLTAERVRDYCAAQGYPPGIGHWMGQAVQHLARRTAANAPTAGEALGRVILDTSSTVAMRPAVVVRDAQPGRTGARKRQRFIDGDGREKVVITADRHGRPVVTAETWEVHDGETPRLDEDDHVLRPGPSFAPITGEIVVSRDARGRARLVADARGIRFVQPGRTDE